MKAAWSGCSSSPAASPSTVVELGAVVGDREREAGVGAAAVEQDRAGAALAVVAALLRAGQPEVLAQEVEQRGADVDVEAVLLAVDPEGDLGHTGNATRPRARRLTSASIPSSTRSRPKVNSSSGSSSWSNTPDARAAWSAGKRSASVSRASCWRHAGMICPSAERAAAAARSSRQRRLVADVAADQQDHRQLLALGQAGVAERAQAVLQPGDLVGHHGRAADRHVQDPGVPPQRVVVGPRPAGHARRASPRPPARARAARRRPRRPSARAARPWPPRSGRATSRTSRARVATRLIETAAIPSARPR